MIKMLLYTAILVAMLIYTHQCDSNANLYTNKIVMEVVYWSDRDIIPWNIQVLKWWDVSVQIIQNLFMMYRPYVNHIILRSQYTFCISITELLCQTCSHLFIFYKVTYSTFNICQHVSNCPRKQRLSDQRQLDIKKQSHWWLICINQPSVLGYLGVFKKITFPFPADYVR